MNLNLSIMSSFPKMCSKRSLKGLSWQLTHILGLGVPSGGGVGVGLACRSVGDIIWCTVGMKVTKTYHFHENNKYTMYSLFLFKNWITFRNLSPYIEEHLLVIPSIIQIGRNVHAFWYGVRRMQLRFERKWLYELWICWVWVGKLSFFVVIVIIQTDQYTM